MTNAVILFEDFVRMCTLADIPLDKIDKMRPFLVKHSNQGGVLPGRNILRKYYLPSVFDRHQRAITDLLLSATMISIIADETTDHRDRSVLNILARVRNKLFIIDVHFLEARNHQTLSQSIIKCVTTYGVQYNVIKSVKCY